MKLTPTEEKLILHWGEMGSKWGVSRTVANIHALLMVSQWPLCAEEIATTLSIARSNVSTSIRELLGWEIIRPVHVLGDRREHYESLKDVWEMARIIAEKRKRREIEPTAHMLKNCLGEIDPKDKTQDHIRERLTALLDFSEVVLKLYEQLARLPTPVLVQLCKLDNTMDKLLGLLKK